MDGVVNEGVNGGVNEGVNNGVKRVVHGGSMHNSACRGRSQHNTMQ